LNTRGYPIQFVRETAQAHARLIGASSRGKQPEKRGIVAVAKGAFFWRS